MKVYIESNFLLELALKQKESDVCEEFIGLAAGKKISLYIPSIAVSEAFFNILTRNENQRKLKSQLEERLQQTRRSALFDSKPRIYDQIPRWIRRLEGALNKEKRSFEETTSNVLKTARIIELTSEIFRTHTENLKEWKPDNRAPKSGEADCLIFSSVQWHRGKNTNSKAMFVSRDDGFHEVLRQKFFEKILSGIKLKPYPSFKSAIEAIKHER